MPTLTKDKSKKVKTKKAPKDLKDKKNNTVGVEENSHKNTRKERKKKPSKRKKEVAAPTVSETLVDDIVNPDVPAPKEEVKPEVKVHAAEPFSDGIVCKELQGFIGIPKVADAETDLLKGFLKYYHDHGTFIGSIANRTSFMKKKGGRLI